MAGSRPATAANSPLAKRRWWGWGTVDKSFPLPTHSRQTLFAELGIDPREPSGAEPQLPTLPPSALDASAGPYANAIDSAGGPASHAASLQPPCELETDFAARLRCASGRSTPDLIRLRFDRLTHAPDAVALPANEDEIAALMQWAAREEVALVPFGGGTSVVGGVTAMRGDKRAVFAVDLRKLDRLLSLEPESGLARAQAGMLGPELERQLQSKGYSLGHFPQSFEFSTLGGWLATRSAGQNSTLYGKIEHMAAALRMVAPNGVMESRALPACATGPELDQVMIGSEGVLGILTEGTMRIHPMPTTTAYQSFFFPEFAGGFAAAREIMQAGLRPAVFRLSDETETRLLMQLGGADRSRGVKLLRMLGKGRFLDGCHFMLGHEGDEKLVRAQAALCTRIARRNGGMGIGGGPGRKWEKERFELPYFRDTLLDIGVVVETFETAAPWAQLPALHQALQKLPATLILAHISHAYQDGASLYITWLADAPDPDQALELWQRVKDAAGEIIMRHGATISHHHAVGTDHKRWMAQERGEGQMQILRSLKQSLDPQGILNPGKLIPDVQNDSA